MGLIINPRQIIKDGITSLRDVWSSSKVSTELSGKQATLVSGVNIKTINTQSLLGSGDIHISGGGDIPKINMTATTATLDPNKFYVWGEVASLDISLAPEIAGIENIYKFQFQSGDVATTLSLPAEIKWNNNYTPTFGRQGNRIVSIQSNIATVERKYDSSIVPPEYQQVEYLKSTGTQFINTNVQGIGTDTIKIKLQTEINGAWTFGTRIAWHSNALHFNKIANTSDVRCFFTNIAESYNYTASNDGNVHIVTIDNGSFFIDDTLIKMYTPQSFASWYIALFAAYSRDEGFIDPASYSIYNATIIRNGAVIADMYPCYRLIDHVAGFYDIVRNIFLINAGTGSFIVGPDV